jgi:thymidylate kinase
VPVLIAVWGASPGVGKSTLCAGLERWLTGAGQRVDHFREEEVLTRPQYAAVAREFRATGRVEPVTLLEATKRYVDSILASGIDVVVADALMPYVPSLLAMGQSDQEIHAFTSCLSPVLAPLNPIMIFLDGDAGTALSRAATREDVGWLDWYTSKLARYQVTPAVHDAASAARYLRRERAVMLSAASRHDWDLITIDDVTAMTTDQVLNAAIQKLTPRVARHHASGSRTAQLGGASHDLEELGARSGT